jgi:hypothetical protein
MPVLSFDTRQTISGANTCVNTWHCFVPATPTVAEANAILAPFKAFFDAHVLYRSAGTVPVTGSRVLYWPESAWTKPVIDPITHKVTTKGYFNTEPLIIGATPATSTSGTGTGFIPPQLASVVSWRTATSGRSGRGRTYLGNISQNAQSGSLITAAFVTAVNTAATTLISAVRALSVGGTPPYLCVWSPTKGTTRETLSGVMDGTFDTMRSRVK